MQLNVLLWLFTGGILPIFVATFLLKGWSNQIMFFFHCFFVLELSLL